MVQVKVAYNLIRSSFNHHLKNHCMNINIQTVHFDADEKLVEFVNRKLEKLETFHDRITKVEVFLKLDNLVHSIKDKVVEIKIHIPKQDCFVKSTSKTFETSFENAFDSIVNQLKKKKERIAA
jgi:putative sigma-54 modulation protein